MNDKPKTAQRRHETGKELSDMLFRISFTSYTSAYEMPFSAISQNVAASGKEIAG